MTDPIDEIDRLHAEANLFSAWAKREEGCCGMHGTVYSVSPQFTDRGNMRGIDASLIVALVNAWPAIRERLKAAERKSAPRTRHDGDCSIYRSLSNGCPHDGICTCGYSHERLFECDSSQMFSEERLKAMRGEEVDQ